MLVSLFILPAAGVGVAVWKRAEIRRFMRVNALFKPQNIVENFSNMKEVFFHAPLALPQGQPVELPQNMQELPQSTQNWIKERALTAIVVLKDGKLVHEAYFQDTNQNDLRISWSIAKSFLSALFGILLEEGAIDSIDDPVIKYAPELANSAYEKASIRNVLNMASGVEFNEDYLDFKSDINKMGRVLALGRSMDGFSKKVKGTTGAPGESWQYVSIDTHVIGMVMRGATGRSIQDLMVEKLLAPMGLEADPIMLTDGKGVDFVLGGLNLRTRDYARFGLMFAQGGKLNGKQIVPADWVEQSTKPSAPTAKGEEKYGFQWWVPEDYIPGEYFARGIYGQFVYINTQAGVVVAVNSADGDFREDGSFEQNLEAFRTIAAALN